MERPMRHSEVRSLVKERGVCNTGGSGLNVYAKGSKAKIRSSVLTDTTFGLVREIFGRLCRQKNKAGHRKRS